MSTSTRPLSRALRVALPLAAVAVSAAACSGASGYDSPAGASRPTVSAAPAAPATVEVRTGPLGRYLTDATGRAVYLFAADKAGTPTCTGTCATAWPPVTTTAAPTPGSGTSGSALGTVRRPDGTSQVTYRGHPLYYFVKDTSAGTTAGQGSKGFGAPWWVVSPDGEAIRTAAAAPSTAPGSADAPADDYGY